MGLDRRTFLTAFSVAPAASLITGAAGCQPTESASKPFPPLQSLRDVPLDDAIEPAVAFVPLRRQP